MTYFTLKRFYVFFKLFIASKFNYCIFCHGDLFASLSCPYCLNTIPQKIHFTQLKPYIPFFHPFHIMHILRSIIYPLSVLLLFHSSTILFILFIILVCFHLIFLILSQKYIVFLRLHKQFFKVGDVIVFSSKERLLIIDDFHSNYRAIFIPLIPSNYLTPKS